MKNYKLVNNIAGWVTFVIAAFVYLSTIEPTASFWDCGEFISSAFKLEVGHPPGAPFFMILGRFFTLFAGNNVTRVAPMVNSMSALFSALTILFLFWSITFMAKRLIVKDGAMSTGHLIAIIGSGLVGALAYTFSDTFWFSAVEGEVYASSSLFTALVFWAILKWERVANEPHANRWIIFIAYLMGLSIGVHLLNLLAIPAIVLVYYCRKYKVTTAGLIKSLLLSVLILGSIMYVIIPGFIKIAAFFELLFVNSFGLPYNSGTIFYGLILISLIVYGLYHTVKHQKVILNTIILVITVILIGYSSYAMLVIRSGAETPMDQNDPEDLFSLLYYLNREQYGDRPLVYGQYFNAPIIATKEGKPSYYKENGKYKKTSFRVDYVYDKKFTTLFPRMWSSDDDGGHYDAYMQWAKIKESELFPPMLDNNGTPMRNREGKIVYDHSKPRKSPSFAQNLRFMWRYQINYMYLRYFMWNFAGRQNDVQGNFKTEINKGNWISGIPFIDNARIGNQDKIPDSMKNNKARNRYFMLPLLLGLFGLIYHNRNHKNDFNVTLILFIMTGLAIVIYLNQNPLQPRERDYAYAGSFYAFAIWIGLGVAALYNLLGKFIPRVSGAILATLISLVAVPVLMASENWDDHNRSGRYMTRDFAYNYLNSCAKNAVLFTNGDNDTFPLWYAQEVEGIRTDVRVMNLSYLAADWYIEQMQRKAYDSDPVPFSMTKDKYRAGKRDVVHVFDKIPGYVDLRKAIEFVASDDPRTKEARDITSQSIDYIPTPRFYIPVDSAKVLRNGTVPKSMASQIPPQMAWELNRNQTYLTKNHLMILDLLSNNNWERPIYYAITVSDDNYLNLENYFQMEGMAYRITPVPSQGDGFGRGGINTDIMYDNMVNKFQWGGVENPNLYLDENVVRMFGNYRSGFARLALNLIHEGKKDSARKALDRCLEVIPEKSVPFSGYNLLLVEAYYQIGDMEKGNRIANAIKNSVYQDMEYFRSLEPKYNNSLLFEKQLAFYSLNQLKEIAKAYKQADLEKEAEEKLQKYSNSIYFPM
jgi:hypothetical protein